MKRLKPIVVCMLLGITVGLTACSDKTKDDTSSDDSTPPTNPTPVPGAPATPPTVTSSAPLSIQMSTKFDGTDYSNMLTFVETGTDTCTASTTTPAVTCTVVVPEGRLYYSSLTLAYSYMPANCRLMTFQPYYYRASKVDGYVPPNVTTGGVGVKCAGISEPAGAACFGGPAVQLVPGFPNYRALIHLPDESNMSTPVGVTKTVDSAYSKGWRSNRHTVNDMSLVSQASDQSIADLGGIGDTYVANTYVDYKFSCQDNWADPETFVINLKVTEENTSAAGPNDFLSWKELP